MEDGCFQEHRLSRDKICPVSQYGNCRDIPHVLNVLFIQVKSQFHNKIWYFYCKMSIYCTTQECDNVTTPLVISYNRVPLHYLNIADLILTS